MSHPDNYREQSKAAKNDAAIDFSGTAKLKKRGRKT
jgi:hypothetical protein